MIYYILLTQDGTEQTAQSQHTVNQWSPGHLTPQMHISNKTLFYTFEGKNIDFCLL